MTPHRENTCPTVPKICLIKKRGDVTELPLSSGQPQLHISGDRLSLRRKSQWCLQRKNIAKQQVRVVVYSNGWRDLGGRILVPSSLFVPQTKC